MQANQFLDILKDRLQALNEEILIADLDILAAQNRKTLAEQQVAYISQLMKSTGSDAPIKNPEVASTQVSEAYADKMLQNVAEASRKKSEYRKGLLEAAAAKAIEPQPADLSKLSPEAQRAYELAMVQNQRRREAIQNNPLQKEGTLAPSDQITNQRRSYPTERKSNLTATILDILGHNSPGEAKALSLREIVNELKKADGADSIKEGSVRTTLHALKKREKITQHGKAYALLES